MERAACSVQSHVTAALTHGAALAPPLTLLPRFRSIAYGMEDCREEKRKPVWWRLRYPRSL